MPGENIKRPRRQTNIKFLFLRDVPPRKRTRGPKKQKKKNIRNAGRKKTPTVSAPPPKTALLIPKKVKPTPVKGKQKGSIVISVVCLCVGGGEDS